MTIEDIKTKATPILRTNGVEYAAVFGSAARGEARPDSDVDFLVRFNRDISLLDHIGAAYALQDSLGQKVDLITEGSLIEDIVPSIRKDLIVLYGKSTRPDLL